MRVVNQLVAFFFLIFLFHNFDAIMAMAQTAVPAWGGTQPCAVAIGGSVTGSNCTTAIKTRPQWPYSTNAATTGSTISLPTGFAVYDITASGLIAALTIKLPPSPNDADIIIIATMSPAAITLLNVQDASGNAVETGITLATKATAKYQFQATAWQRIGN